MVKKINQKFLRDNTHTMTYIEQLFYPVSNYLFASVDFILSGSIVFIDQVL